MAWKAGAMGAGAWSRSISAEKDPVTSQRLWGPASPPRVPSYHFPLVLTVSWLAECGLGAGIKLFLLSSPDLPSITEKLSVTQEGQGWVWLVAWDC